MKLKKSIGRIFAALCIAGTMAPVLTSLPSYAEETAVYDSFEVNYDGWHGTSDGVKLSAVCGAGANGSRGMTVSCRSDASDGASSSKGFYLSGGVKYTYSVWVKSEEAETFRLSLTCADEEGNETRTVLAEEFVPAGKWTELRAKYKAPAGSSGFELSVSNASLRDFMFDNVSVSSKANTAAVSAASGDKGLKDLFSGYFKVGTILNGNTVNQSAIRSLVTKDFNSVTCENETKPDFTLVQSQCKGDEVGVSLKSASAIFDFCAKNKISVRGHVLVWHSQTPSWFFKENFSSGGNWVTPAVMDKRMESYIKNLFSAIAEQYPSLDLYAYDVVNEAISDDYNRTANAGGAREPGDNNVSGGKSAWVQVYGDNSFIEKAFTYARKYAPKNCKLYYNDYNEYWDHKRDCIYKTCKSLYDKGLLDGVGMQSHINADMGGFSSASAHAAAMKKYLSIGCDVQVTELDVSCENGKFTSEQQAQKYKAIFKAAMDCNSDRSYKGKVTAICLWGPNDANTWLGSSNSPLIFDKNNSPKPAYSAIASLASGSGTGNAKPTSGESKPTEVSTAAPKKNTTFYYNTFEKNKGSWKGKGDAKVTLSSRYAYRGKKALYVSGRTASWNGAQIKLDPKKFVPGYSYTFTAYTMYVKGGKSDTFLMKLQYTDKNGEVQYASVAEGTAKKGKWVKLENKNYVIPGDAKDMSIYIETQSSKNDFFIDEARGKSN